MPRSDINPNYPGLDTGLNAGRVVATRTNRFSNTLAAGGTIAALVDPFGSGSTFATVGTVPEALALSGGNIVRGSGAVTVGGDYHVWIVATSPEGVPQPAVRLTFRAVLPLGGTPSGTPTPTPTPAPTALPTVSGTLRLALGAKRMVQGYSGPLYRLQRASDGASLDVSPAAGSSLPDYAAVRTWATGGGALYVTAIYDQASGANALASSALDKRPLFDLDQALAGCVPFLFDQFTDTDQYGQARYAGIFLPGVNLRDVTILEAVDPLTSYQYQPLWCLYDTSPLLTFGTDHTARVGLDVSDGVASGIAPILPRAQPSVVGVRSSPTGTTVYVREQALVGGGVQANVNVGALFLGWRPSGALTAGQARRWGTVVYSGLTASDALAVRDALVGIFTIPTSFDRRLVYNSDSLGVQYSPRLCRTVLVAAQATLTGQPEIFGTGVNGQRVITDVEPNKATRFDGLYTTAYGAGRCIFVEETGVNDINNGATSAQIRAARASVAAYWKAKGPAARFGLERIIPEAPNGGNATDDGYNTVRLDINANEVVGGNVDFIADPTANAAFSTYPGSALNSTYYIADRVHLRAAGTAIKGAVLAAAVNG